MSIQHLTLPQIVFALIAVMMLAAAVVIVVTLVSSSKKERRKKIDCVKDCSDDAVIRRQAIENRRPAAYDYYADNHEDPDFGSGPLLPEGGAPVDIPDGADDEDATDAERNARLLMSGDLLNILFDKSSPMAKRRMVAELLRSLGDIVEFDEDKKEGEEQDITGTKDAEALSKTEHPGDNAPTDDGPSKPVESADVNGFVTKLPAELAGMFDKASTVAPQTDGGTTDISRT